MVPLLERSGALGHTRLVQAQSVEPSPNFRHLQLLHCSSFVSPSVHTSAAVNEN